MKIFSIFLTISFSWGLVNISLEKTLSSFNNDEYNVLLTPKLVVLSGKKKKTRKAISKGFQRAVFELKRDVTLHDIKLNLKIFSLKKGSDLSFITQSYIEQDKNSARILLNMLKAEVGILENVTKDIAPVKNKSDVVSADDIDISDDAFDISDDTNGDDQDGESIFISSFLELSEQYDKDVVSKKLYEILHPFNVNNKVEQKNINAVIGFAFFPTVYGRIKMMKMYIILVTINTESKKSVNIIAKRIPEKGAFKWDRNYLYISGNTGKVLRQIVSNVLGKNL